MRETWRDYIARLCRNYKVTLDECDRGAVTEDGRRVVTKMLVRDCDGIPRPYAIPVDNLDDYVRPYQYTAVSEALRIPESHADRGF